MTTKQELLARIAANYEAFGRGLSIGHEEGYRQCADLDGKHAKQFLESLGFKVIANGDTGNYGYAQTECGLMLSTNGYICRK